MNSPSPAIVSQQAVKPLPRFGLWLVCCSYVLAGFIGRQPWRGSDLLGHSAIKQFADSDLAWLSLEQLADGNLVYWLASLFNRLSTNPALTVSLSQIIFILALVITLYSTRLSVYYLAQTNAALPVSFAFGGEANPKDYARAIADAALLALIASLGLASIGHEIRPALLQLCGASIVILSCTLHWQKPKIALVCLVFGGLLLTISGQALSSLIILLAVNSCLYLQKQHNLAQNKIYYYLISLGLAGVLAWLIANSSTSLGLQHLSSAFIYSWIKLWIWFFWPCWVIALWGLWKWRRQLLKFHILLPLTIFISSSLLSLFSKNPENILLPAITASAILAAFALPTLKRNISAFIDWLTLLLFTAFAIFLWLMWFAGVFGIPSKLQANIAKQLQDYQMSWQWLPFALAATASILWLFIIRWRTSHHPPVIWKSLVLPAYGVTLGWFLLNTIWLEPLNASKGFQYQSRQLISAIGDTKADCIYVQQLNQYQLSALRYYTAYNYRSSQQDSGCQLLISTDLNISNSQHQWQLIAQAKHQNIHRQTLWLYKLVN